MIPAALRPEPVKLIIPMARPPQRESGSFKAHPFIELAGKPILHHIIENATHIIDNPPSEIAFVLGKDSDFATEKLGAIAGEFGSNVRFYFQDEPKGTAHALHCASESLEGQVLVVYADTLFESDFKIKNGPYNVIWVKKVEAPEKFGVIKLNDREEIVDFVEKPQQFVSNLALIGAYYFNDGERLKAALADYLQQSDGEAPLTTVLKSMMEQKMLFEPAISNIWFDCESTGDLLDANHHYLGKIPRSESIHPSASINGSIINSPVYIGEGVKIDQAIIGPHVSISAGSSLENAVLKNSVVEEDCHISYHCLENSVIGKGHTLEGQAKQVLAPIQAEPSGQ